MLRLRDEKTYVEWVMRRLMKRLNDEETEKETYKGTE